MAHEGPQYAQSIRGITERIAFEMGDAEPGLEFQGLDQKWIAARVRDTFKWLAGRRPNLFASEETFALKKGFKQTLPEGCDSFIEALSVSVAGKDFPVYASAYSALRAAQAYAKLAPPCPDNCVYHAAVSEYSGSEFLLSPPPEGDATITVMCTNMDKYFDEMDTELDCDAAKWINTVVEYVLYLSHSADAENPAASAAADQHRATFFDLAPVQRRAENS